MESRYISVPEAAGILGCSQPWVIKLIKAGELAGFRVNGRAWAVDVASVLRSKQEYASRPKGLVGRPRSNAG